jgi:hypothetical protein
MASGAFVCASGRPVHADNKETSDAKASVLLIDDPIGAS